MASFLTNTFRAVGFLIAAASAQPAAAQQTMNDGSIRLSTSCEELETVEGRRSCQLAFEVFANDLKDRQIAASAGPRYVSFGHMDDPVILPVERPMSESYPVIVALNGACRNIASKKPEQPHSQRLDDGSEIGLLRVAERARICADTAQMVSEVTKGPFMFAHASAIRQNAEEVIPKVNNIAFLIH